MRIHSMIVKIHRHVQWLTLYMLFFSVLGFAQNDTTNVSACSQKDIADIFFNKREKARKEKSTFIMIVPAIGSNPSMGFFYGGVMQMAFRPAGNKRLSMLSAGAILSTKGQTNINGKTNLYLLKDKLFISADFRFAKLSESTYGLGTNGGRKFGRAGMGVNGYDTKGVDSSEMLLFNNTRVFGTASYEIKRNFFLGIGFLLDKYASIKDQSLDLPDHITDHYGYNTREGFNSTHYAVNGISLNAIYDSRDNLVNAYEGQFANINWRLTPLWMGSSQSSSLASYEFRSFHRVSKNKNRNLIGLWIWGQHLISGKLPYLSLPALGYDQRNRSGRGYTFGRFRGEDLFYMEGEYRFQISPCSGILGGVVFLNSTSASDRYKHFGLFRNFQWGYGTGLRIMIDKKTRTNLTVEAAFGRRSSGVYINATETF